MTAFSSEQLYFFKFSTVVLDEFPVALRQVFKYMWDNQVAHLPGFQIWDDSPLVRNMFLNIEGGKTKYVPTAKSYMEWDCTALFEATLYAKSFAIPDRRGGLATLDRLFVKPRRILSGAFHPSVLSPVGNQAETFALALDQLRLLRNNLCHQISTEIDKVTFDHLIQLAKDAFNALGQISRKIDDIGKLGEKDFPVARVQELEEELRAEKFKQIRMELDIKDIGSDVKDIKTEVTDVKNKITEVRTNLQDFGADVQDVKAGITDMMMTMEDVASDLERRETGIKEIMEEVGSYLKEVKTGKQAEKAGISTGTFVPDSCIPDKISNFVGRQEELQRILDHITDETTRVVNIWGSPGFGKTSVAIAAAHCLHHDLKIPVYFAPLRGMESMDELLSKLLSMFTDATQVPHLSSAHWLIQSLQSQKNPFVLILDNADDLLESENSTLKQQVLTFIEEILAQCKHIKLLLTTRASLDFLRYHVQIHLEKISLLDGFSSANLVKCLLPDVSDEDSDCIVNSCGQVPLAMQLMCGIIREESITITELLENLKRSPLVELLDNETFPDDVRLKALMKKSFERLPDREKKAFVSLAVFPGWFKIEEATAVLDVEGGLTTKSILRSLERKSLIECGTNFSVFTIHSLLRSFIYEERKHGNEIEAAFRSAEHRFYDYYICNLSAMNEKFLMGPSIQAWSFFTDRRQSILSSLENGLTDNRLYPKVVEVLSKAEVLLFALLHDEKQMFEHLYDTALQEAKRRRILDDERKLLASKSFRHWGWFSSDNLQTWDDSSSADHTNRADRPPKLYCYQAIHQLLCGKLSDDDISSLVNSVQKLSKSSDEYVLKHLTYCLLERHLQGKDNDKASHFRAFSTNWFEARLPGFNPSEEGIQVEYLRRTIKEDLFFFMTCSKLLNLPEDKQSQSGQFLLHLLNNTDTAIFTNLLMYSAKLPADIILLTYVLKDLKGAEEVLQASELLLGKEEFSPFLETVLLPFLKLTYQLLQSGCNFIQSFKSTKKLMEYLTCVSPKFSIPEYYSHLITEVIENILTANEDAPESDFIDLAKGYDKLGEVKHLFNDDNHGAIVSHHQAISVRKAKIGDHIDTVSSLTNVGCRYFELEIVDDADKAFQSALNLREQLGVYYDVDTAGIYYTLGQNHYARGNYHKASESLQKASQLRQELLGDHLDTSKSLHELGCAFMELGNNKSALDAFLKAADMRSTLLGDHVQTADCYEYLGLVQTRNGDLNEALKSRQKAVNMRSKLLGDHRDTACSYHNLGAVQYAMGDLHEAVESVRKAAQMNGRLYGDNKYTAQCYHTLGLVQNDMGDNQGALESLQKACQLRKNLLGDHSDTAKSFHLLGVVQSKTEDLKGASDSLQKASRLRMELLGNHLNTSKSFYELGRVYMKAGDNNSAVEAFLKAADMRSSLLGDHEGTARTYEYLGLVQERNGDLNGALKSHQKAVNMRSKLFGDHRDSACSYHNLGVVQHAMGDFHEAVESVRKAAHMNGRLYGEHENTAQCYHTLGAVQNNMGDNKGALESLQKACQLRKDLLGDHPETAESFHLLGVVQSKTEDLKGASDSLQKASQLRMELLGNHLDTSKSFHQLGRVYMNAGDNNSAVEAFLKAADMRSTLLGDHVQTADSYAYLGLVQGRNGDLNGALKSHRKAVNMRSKLLGDHGETACSYHNLGVVQRAVGDLHEAAESVQKAAQMNVRLYGDNKNTAQCYHTLGVVQNDMGDNKGALESLQKACQLRKDLLGDHPDTAESFHLLGEVQISNTGNLKGASDSLQKASQLRQNLLGDHPDTAKSFHLLGVVQSKTEDLKGASDSLQKASRLRMELLGNHLNTSKSFHQLGRVYMKAGDNKSAVEAFLKAADMRSSLLGDHEETAWTYEYLGLVQRRNGDLNGALKSNQKAVNMRSKLLGDHGDTACSYHNLGAVQYAMGDFHEAVESVRKAAQMNAKLYGEHKNTAQCYHTLGVVQNNMGDNKGALESLQKACQLRRNLLGDHPDTTESFHLLEEVQSNTGDLKGASDSLQKETRLRTNRLWKRVFRK